MADRFDVSARLAEGRPAVEHTQAYVDACHQLGYQQPDLTAHTSQVWDWYDAEAGLDLRILDDDTGALRAAVNAIEEALWVQRTQVTELAVAWRGSGADAAMRFLQRHCDVAAEVAAHVGAAAERYAALRDDVWKSVDGKVADAVAIDERRAAERSSWLAACHSVAAGTGDRSTAEQVVRQQVKPYVDNDIRNDWIVAMGAGSASVAASYDEAIHALASTSEVRFDIPGDFGPSWQPAFEECPVAEATPTVSLPAEPAPTVPAAAPAIRPPISPEPQTLSADGIDDAAPMPADLAAPLGDASGLSTGAGNLGGLGGVTGGIGGVVGSIVDSIGSILGSLAGGLGDGSGSGDSLTDDPLDLDDDDEEDDTDTEDKAEPISVDDAETAEQPADPVTENPPTARDSVAEPVGQPVDPSPPAAPPDDQPPPVAAPQTDGSTPCEIAEDELPQAGQ
ncbi:MAG TPA: hypothetical protein VGH69_11775 [Mycobacterium sp.]